MAPKHSLEESVWWNCSTYWWRKTLNTPNKLCLAHFWACLFLPFLQPAWFCAELHWAVLLVLQKGYFIFLFWLFCCPTPISNPETLLVWTYQVSVRLIVHRLQLGAWLGFLVCTIGMLLQHYHRDLQCVKVGHLCGDYSEEEEDWWPLATFYKKSSGAVEGRSDLSQPVDKAEVTRKRVNLGTSDEKLTHFLMETHIYLYLQICWLWTMSWRLLF
jgi:hypothetical protein